MFADRNKVNLKVVNVYICIWPVRVRVCTSLCVVYLMKITHTHARTHALTPPPHTHTRICSHIDGVFVLLTGDVAVNGHVTCLQII